jgi:nitrate/nitrite-specific signal transduction histidine kinase
LSGDKRPDTHGAYVEKVRQGTHRYAQELREENETLRRLIAELEEESRRRADQFREIEQQNSNLANLYVASYRLHGTLDRTELLAILQEIVANLIGCEEMGVFELDGEAEVLRLAAAHGIDPGRFAEIRVGAGIIGRCVRDGESFVNGSREGARLPEEAHLTACVPLKLEGRAFGAIALFRLLPQKAAGYEPIDYELFDLLASHAATALYATRLHAERRR